MNLNLSACWLAEITNCLMMNRSSLKELVKLTTKESVVVSWLPEGLHVQYSQHKVLHRPIFLFILHELFFIFFFNRKHYERSTILFLNFIYLYCCCCYFVSVKNMIEWWRAASVCLSKQFTFTKLTVSVKSVLIANFQDSWSYSMGGTKLVGYHFVHLSTYYY